jgi:hypothetical protein
MELHPAPGASFNSAHQRVAVGLAVGESEEDFEGDGGEGKEAPGIGWAHDSSGQSGFDYSPWTYTL